MFYEPGQPHGLPRNPFKACIVPRPIGWISTISENGKRNLAPYSQFNVLSFDPPYVMIACNQNAKGQRKDTAANIEQKGFFCWNMATYDLREAVNISARHVDEDEFDLAGVTSVEGKITPCPMVRESPVNFECEYYTTVRLPGPPPTGSTNVVIGKVVGVHIDESVLTDGFIDMQKAKPIARLGYLDYCVVDGEKIFSMRVPGGKGEVGGMNCMSGVDIIPGKQGR